MSVPFASLKTFLNNYTHLLIPALKNTKRKVQDSMKEASFASTVTSAIQYKPFGYIKRQGEPER